jgi:predicted enzyme related to lactoylglutathione lyase
VDFQLSTTKEPTLTERDGYEHGVPCWVDTWQEDADTAATFYAGVFGWDVEKGTPPGADRRYYMCRLGGRQVAAIGSPPPAGMAPAWTTYVWVDDADAVAASAVMAGGSLLAEPFGSLDGGRVAIVADPSGAVFGVWTRRRSGGAARQRAERLRDEFPAHAGPRGRQGLLLGGARVDDGGVRPDAVVAPPRLRGRGPRAAGVA